MFERTRSNSLGAIPTEIEKPVVKQSEPIEQTTETQTVSSDQKDTSENEWQRDKIPVKPKKGRKPVQ